MLGSNRPLGLLAGIVFGLGAVGSAHAGACEPAPWAWQFKKGSDGQEIHPTILRTISPHSYRVCLTQGAEAVVLHSVPGYSIKLEGKTPKVTSDDLSLLPTKVYKGGCVDVFGNHILIQVGGGEPYAGTYCSLD